MVFARSNPYWIGQRIRLKIFDFTVSSIHGHIHIVSMQCSYNILQVFRIRRYLLRFHHSALTSGDTGPHSLFTQLTWSLTRRWLSWRGTILHVNWANVELKFRHRRHLKLVKCFINSALTQARGVLFSVELVDCEYHSGLTQAPWSLIQRWFSWQGVSLRVNSGAVESYSALI